MTKCNKSVRSAASNFTVEINRPVNCQTKNLLYCISCDRCPVQYIGESERTLQERFSEHKGYAVNMKTSKATGEHFSQKTHKVSDMKVSVL